MRLFFEAVRNIFIFGAYLEVVHIQHASERCTPAPRTYVPMIDLVSQLPFAIKIEYSMEAQGAESSRSLRQQVLQSNELILKAVDVLQGKESESNSSVSATRPAPTHGRGHGSTNSEKQGQQEEKVEDVETYFLLPCE